MVMMEIKKIFTIFMLFICNCVLVVIGFDKNLVLDYLQTIRNVKYVTVFRCDDSDQRPLTAGEISASGLYCT